MSTPEIPRIVRAPCDNCGGVRNHVVLKEHLEQWREEDSGWWERSLFQICQCQGCDTIRFRVESTNPGDVGPEGYIATVNVYPERKQQRHQANDHLAKLPVVGTIYAETVAAFNADSLILAGGGLRATVEAICKEQNIGGKTLEARIDALVSNQLLAKPQADLLHEERYIGNTALHEIERPSASDVSIGLEIVEGLLNTIYVLPSKAEKLRKARNSRADST